MRLDRFAIYAWGVLGYNLLVVLWGAFVRATGSGAGCGDHWPLCNGTVVPRAESVATVIEFTHRLSSGLALLAVVAMLVWALRAFAPGHRVRAAAVASTILIFVEALLGAGLVLFELVGLNASWLRAFSMVAHLVNTFLLVAALTITAWWASGGAPVRLRRQGTLGWTLAAALGGLLLVGATGAIAALGDTLFPARTLSEGLRDSFSADSHPLIQLRKLHPFLAIAVGALVVLCTRAAARARPSAEVRWLASAAGGLYVAQLLAGTINIVLLAPVWMQLVHLLLADLLWVALVLLAASALAVESGEPAATIASAGARRAPALP